MRYLVPLFTLKISLCDWKLASIYGIIMLCQHTECLSIMRKYQIACNHCLSLFLVFFKEIYRKFCSKPKIYNWHINSVLHFFVEGEFIYYHKAPLVFTFSVPTLGTLSILFILERGPDPIQHTHHCTGSSRTGQGK